MKEITNRPNVDDKKIAVKVPRGLNEAILLITRNLKPIISEPPKKIDGTKPRRPVVTSKAVPAAIIRAHPDVATVESAVSLLRFRSESLKKSDMIRSTRTVGRRSPPRASITALKRLSTV